MNKRERENYVWRMNALQRMGIPYTVAEQLRRISMTLHRWHEKECNGEVERDDNGRARRQYGHGRDGAALYMAVRDMETGARRRLALIMKDYPALVAYVQGDPRGAALYIVERARVPAGVELDSCYSSYGVAVY